MFITLVHTHMSMWVDRARNVTSALASLVGANAGQLDCRVCLFQAHCHNVGHAANARTHELHGPLLQCASIAWGRLHAVLTCCRCLASAASWLVVSTSAGRCHPGLMQKTSWAGTRTMDGQRSSMDRHRRYVKLGGLASAAFWTCGLEVHGMHDALGPARHGSLWHELGKETLIWGVICWMVCCN